jgi:2-phosphosulfolactate phosphatase
LGIGQVEIIPGLKGAAVASEIKATAVIIDVFRASSSIVTLLEKGARQIMPVSTVAESLCYKPLYIIVGERGEKKLKGFDFDNSPSLLNNLDWHDKKVVITTSNGTKGLCKAKGAKEILIGCLLNARAIANYTENAERIILVPIGENSQKHIEDDLCAELIKNYIEGKPVDLANVERKILDSTSAENLKERGLTEDLMFCLKVNTSNIVPIMDSNGIISKSTR